MTSREKIPEGYGLRRVLVLSVGARVSSGREDRLWALASSFGLPPALLRTSLDKQSRAACVAKQEPSRVPIMRVPSPLQVVKVAFGKSFVVPS